MNSAPTHTRLSAIFVSLELSRSTWLVTALSPASGEKMSKFSITAGDTAELLSRISILQDRAIQRTGYAYPITTIQEAGLDGFWLHRVLMNEGIESNVVDPASITVSRRRRRAKTDRLDGEILLRTLMAYTRGEPHVCAMVHVPSAEEEDQRRISRERKTLIGERVTHVNRIKGLLYSQGVSGYEPLHRDRRKHLDELKTGDGRDLPVHLKRQISRELDRLELLLEHIKSVEADRNKFLLSQVKQTKEPQLEMLLAIKGIGAEVATILWTEALYRHFDNRRQIASYAGLAPTPWQSGSIDREQGVSKAGNPRLRVTLVQTAWLWLQHQPNSALSKWFRERTQANQGRRKKSTIVALALSNLPAEATLKQLTSTSGWSGKLMPHVQFGPRK
ncbi:IS110 family transposase [Rhizobium azibense]